MKIKNPILPGFNADPSIIRVEDKYYIANSTFEWFPGVRLHESKDLVHWSLLPSPISKSSFINMQGDPASGGIWAPDLSYADGKFWLVYTDVKITQGPFKDMINYLITADNIAGPWSEPIKLNGVGFDPSLFHDTDGRKYLVQQTWDHREYHNPFNGITLTELDLNTMKPIPSTSRTIYEGTDVKLVEGPHIYRIKNRYYLFAAQGGTSFEHQEVVARSKSLSKLSFESEPNGPFITNFDTPDSYLQKQGHGSLVSTPDNDWYYASLVSRPWNHKIESKYNPRGWSTLGRETSLQKVEWDKDDWPRVVGGKGGQVYVDAPKSLSDDSEDCINNSRYDDFSKNSLDYEWNTLRKPLTDHNGYIKDSSLTLIGRGSLSNTFDVSMLAQRWSAFNFDATTKVKFDPENYQQMAGLVNFYNDKHWSWIFITNDEEKGKVIEISENDNNDYHSFLKANTIKVPDDIDYVWLKTKVRKTSYVYEYSFDGTTWNSVGSELDAAILSDDYVLKTYGGFFTGAFVGLAAVDYSGYEKSAIFDFFNYKELGNQ